MSRSSLESQKLDLMDEMSHLKLELVSAERTHTDAPPQDPADAQQNKAEVRGLRVFQLLLVESYCGIFRSVTYAHMNYVQQRRQCPLSVLSLDSPSRVDVDCVASPDSSR